MSEIPGPFLGILKKFNPYDWLVIKTQLEKYFTVNSVFDEEQKKAVLLNLLDEQTYKHMADYFYPELLELVDYSKLIGTMDLYTLEQDSVINRRYLFYTARKRPDESLQNWADRLKIMAQHCNFKDSPDIILKDRFTFGMDLCSECYEFLEEHIHKSFDNTVQLLQNRDDASHHVYSCFYYGYFTHNQLSSYY